MRTVLHFGAAMAITILIAGVAASCALPAYHAGESTSTGGGGERGAASSSGQGGAASASSSSKAASSSSSSGVDVDGGDGGACNPAAFEVCSVPAGTPCDCPEQACYFNKCNNATGGTVPWQVCDKISGKWIDGDVLKAPQCCLGLTPCRVDHGQVCRVTHPGPQQTPTCIQDPCKALMMDLACPGCGGVACPNPLSCMVSNGVLICN